MDLASSLAQGSGHIPRTRPSLGFPDKSGLVGGNFGHRDVLFHRYTVLDPLVFSAKRTSTKELFRRVDCSSLPKVNPGYLTLENVTLLPHLGSATIETGDAMKAPSFGEPGCGAAEWHRRTGSGGLNEQGRLLPLPGPDFVRPARAQTSPGEATPPRSEIVRITERNSSGAPPVPFDTTGTTA